MVLVYMLHAIERVGSVVFTVQNHFVQHLFRRAVRLVVLCWAKKLETT
jgi:hypothetical protein